jgi:hypothetical protein
MHSLYKWERRDRARRHVRWVIHEFRVSGGVWFLPLQRRHSMFVHQRRFKVRTGPDVSLGENARRRHGRWEVRSTEILPIEPRRTSPHVHGVPIMGTERECVDHDDDDCVWNIADKKCNFHACALKMTEIDCGEDDACSWDAVKKKCRKK